MSTAERNWLLMLLPIVGLLICTALLASRGASGVTGGFEAVAATWFTGGSAAVIWMAGALGIGLTVCRAALGERSCLWGVALPVGIAVCLWLAHGVGAIGVLRGAPGMMAAWAAPAAGALMLWREVRGRGGGSRGRRVEIGGVPRGVLLAVIPGAAVLIVAPCLPPGTIWASEAHGYDALSYHLMLAREWIGAGRIEPVEHNVYSFLPSYLEAAYTQLAVMLGAGLREGDTLAGGRWLFAAQSLHALMGVATSVSVASLVRTLLRRIGQHGVSPDACAAVAGGAVLSVPWTIVTGSLAYNELGVTACTAGALALSCAAEGRTAARGLAIGFLLGVGAMCKPTAAYMAWPMALLCVCSWSARGELVRISGPAVIGGVLSAAPWLLRNALSGSSRNPAFPYFTGVFGTGHWEVEQVACWNAEHHPHRSLVDSIARLVSSGGLLHQQWVVFTILAGLSAVMVVMWRGTRRGGWPLAAGLVLQLVAWVLIGHQQARFLMPIIVPGGALLGLAVGVWGLPWRRGAAVGLGAASVGVLGVASTRLFLNEGIGAPCRALESGVGGITGEALGPDDSLRAMPESGLIEMFRDAENPVAAVNRLVGLEAAQAREHNAVAPLVYLLGDATPLYFTVPVLWNTTWDAWPLERAMRNAGPEGLAPRWAGELRRRGVTHVLINYAELARLRRSGYSPVEMTPEFGAAFAREACTPVVEWPRRGCALYRLRAPE